MDWRHVADTSALLTAPIIHADSSKWREVKATEKRKKVDFAQCMKELMDVHFLHVVVIQVKVDNLNTHATASLSASFEPAEARRLLRKQDVHFTPNHGSCLKRRVSSLQLFG